MAYYEMFTRDAERFRDALRRINVMPLGAAALAGTTYPIDRAYTARLLDFPAVSANSIDAVSDRDFMIEFLAAASICMVHFSRLSEELILWSSAEFGFIEMPDAFATGSSIMPQKKNPDVPELVRGKTGRVFGSLMALLTLMKSLPLAYNRDMQEDKAPLFDAVDTLKACIDIYTRMLPNLTSQARSDAGRDHPGVFKRHGHGRLPGHPRDAFPRGPRVRRAVRSPLPSPCEKNCMTLAWKNCRPFRPSSRRISSISCPSNRWSTAGVRSAAPRKTT